jgi:hypothetical protein
MWLALLAAAACSEMSPEAHRRDAAPTDYTWPEPWPPPCEKGGDADGDRIPDEVEGGRRDTDGDRLPDDLGLDSDNDTLLDGWEDLDGDGKRDIERGTFICRDATQRWPVGRRLADLHRRGLRQGQQGLHLPRALERA